MSAPSLQLDGTLWLRSGDQPWGGQHRIDLLAQIEATGSISAAARAAGMSYKDAWDAIDAMNNLAGEPLVLRSAGGRGGGGTLAAIITEESARDLALAAGTPVCALFDAASVMLGVLD
ncbi:TOBE domain-containing protein [Bordetella parapertussis]|uniref:Molybdenum-binding protein n=1 Tax=Bordetella parapertussis (strain Bpp5) TaxID=1208660 RepID=K0MDW9_BORPB|nr:TOBE domain-containing protein [Bordetella parapertussis]CCJ48930.1 Putative molybdenum-binding protein [Bordetella parapertussis Bpp5]